METRRASRSNEKLPGDRIPEHINLKFENPLLNSTAIVHKFKGIIFK